MKNRSFAFILALSATLLPGCDQDNIDDHGDDPRGQAIALGGLNDEQADAIEAQDNPSDLSSLSSPALAGDGWRRVCANSLTLKSAPGGGGGSLGTLYNGWWFYKSGTNGAWSVGYSNELGVWGWVLSQYLC